MQIANAEASDSSDADEDGELVDTLYVKQNFVGDEEHAKEL